jgi:sugar (pentulose or hexulose) kinase
VSDILGVEQVWPLSSGGALGDAMLVAWANGLTDFRGGLARWLQVGDRTWPNKGAHGVYDARYRTWLLLRDHVAAALGDS